MTINSKRESYEKYFAGEFGNTLQFWKTIWDYQNWIYEETGYERTKKLVALRTIHKPGIQLPYYCTPQSYDNIISIAFEWMEKYNIKSQDITVNEVGPDDAIVIQGEIQRSVLYYDLRYTTYPAVMREAFKHENKHTHGLEVCRVIDKFMDTPSKEKLTELFNDYPDSIIEFSTYNKSVGKLGWNTVFWEVRNY